jgi:GNAT superfamily N-acetyltransferase
MITRAATTGDLESIRAIADSYGNLANWPQRPDYLDHELSRGGFAVCEAGGEILGFGAVLERNGIAHVADLFVRPDQVGNGIGRAILGELLKPGVVRLTFASKDPRALPLYVRFGMLPMAPLLYLTADAEATIQLPDHGVRLVESGAAGLAKLDQNASGRDRIDDLDFMLSQVRASGFLATLGEDVIGYGICRLAETGDGSGAHAYLGPIGAPNAPDALRTATAILRWAGEHAAHATIPVFGPNAATPALLNANFRIEDVDTFMASWPGLIDMERYFPSVELG